MLRQPEVALYWTNSRVTRVQLWWTTEPSAGKLWRHARCSCCWCFTGRLYFAEKKFHFAIAATKNLFEQQEVFRGVETLLGPSSGAQTLFHVIALRVEKYSPSTNTLRQMESARTTMSVVLRETTMPKILSRGLLRSYMVAPLNLVDSVREIAVFSCSQRRSLFFCNLVFVVGIFNRDIWLLFRILKISNRRFLHKSRATTNFN